MNKVGIVLQNGLSRVKAHISYVYIKCNIDFTIGSNLYFAILRNESGGYRLDGNVHTPKPIELLELHVTSSG